MAAHVAHQAPARARRTAPGSEPILAAKITTPDVPHWAVRRQRVTRLIADGTIAGGMIPKVETCIYALDQGVEGVVIMDGKVPHAVLLELLTDHGVGTLMHR